MSKIEEKLAKSLTADTIELIPYLPYLLQDLWELGSSPNDMVHLISKHILVTNETKVLDLACGKGAVSIHIAKTFGCHVKGVDIMPEFIEDAIRKAKEYGVEAICEFVVADINISVEIEKDFDVVILGAVGEVLGNPEETLHKLSATIKTDGYVLLDDGYAISESDAANLTKNKYLKQIKKAGFQLIEDLLVNEAEFIDVVEEQMEKLSIRTNELKKKHPKHAHLFDQYLKSQLAEIDELENDLIGVTMLLKKAVVDDWFL
ncbi:MAG: class I SAM-dependent methyltransferase [Acholeplasmataceae bacterium]|nr:class I SAM-dependent methyltransferase [Acholeplasmataceae bacterium]